MLNYLLLSSTGLLVLVAFYFLFHKDNTFFQQNRITLLFGLVVSIVFPLFESILSTDQQIYISEVLPVVYLPELTIGNTSVIYSNKGWNWEQVTLFTYFTFVLLLLIRFIISNLKLIVFISQNYKTQYRGNTLIHTQGKYPTFAYLKYIFWDNTKSLSKKEEELIFLHEQTHIHEFHSVDIFIMEILKIIFWFHPAIYIIDAALRTQHEYLADQKASKMTNDASYSQLMIRSLFEELSINVGHGFQFSTVKSRIKMLKKERTNQWKRVSSLFTFITLTASIIFLQACVKDEITNIDPRLAEYNQEKVYGYNINGRTYWDINSKYSKNVDTKEVANIFGLKEHELPKDFNSNVKFALVFQYKNDLDKDFIEKIKMLPSTSHELISPVKKKDAPKGVVLIDELETENDQIVEIAQNPANFPGGLDEFYKNIGKTLRYPQEAKEKGITGKVYVQFVINKEGNGEDIKILNSTNPIFNEEVLRVAKLNLKGWTPANHEGKIVKQRLVLPLTFKLE